jgi:hypothetical protein
VGIVEGRAQAKEEMGNQQQQMVEAHCIGWSWKWKLQLFSFQHLLEEMAKKKKKWQKKKQISTQKENYLCQPFL